uniref:Uncharacterized protein n=1 Tax=Globodera pallida TaxID=36090 RepID=A0A183CNJ0_GLOPA
MDRFRPRTSNTTNCQPACAFPRLNTRKECQTYRCVDGNGSDIFIVNSCAAFDECHDEELNPFCAKEGGRNICDFCKGGLCNKIVPLAVVTLPPPPTTFVPPTISIKVSTEKGGGGVMSLCNFTFTFLLFLGGVLVRWMIGM